MWTIVSWLTVAMMTSMSPAADPTSPESVARENQPVPGAVPLAGPSVETQPSGRGDAAMRPGGRGPMGTGVMQILADRCVSCHGAEKQKGGVRVLPVSALFEGNQADWVIIPGRPQDSVFFERITLPAGHDDIMPPKDPPLSSAEQKMIEDWIKSGSTPKALIDSAGVERGGRVDPRTWAAAYLSLDLTAAQRREAASTLQRLSAKERLVRGSQRRPGSRGSSPTGDANAPNDPTQRQARQQLQAEIASEQVRLWEALTPTQQKAMQAMLDDPDAVKKLRRSGRDRRGGAEGRRRPRQPSGSNDPASP